MQLKEPNEINLTITGERKLWNHLFGNGLIPISDNCPECNKAVSVKENESLNNPYIVRCTAVNAVKQYFYLIILYLKGFLEHQYLLFDI